tara:strand:- start:4039 stop:4758 length:720 start_codon:yes stop_codon:yes gene_type:complete
MPSNNRGRRTQGREERGMMIVTSRPVRATPAEPLVVIAEAFTEAHENQSNHANTIKQLKARIKELEKGSKSKNKEIKTLEKMNEDTTKQLREAYDWKAVEDLPKAVVEKFSLDVSNICAKKFGYETMALMFDDYKGKVDELHELGEKFDRMVKGYNNGIDQFVAEDARLEAENKQLKEREKKIVEEYEKDIASLNEALEEECDAVVEPYRKVTEENQKLKEENQKLKDYIALSDGAPIF